MDQELLFLALHTLEKFYLNFLSPEGEEEWNIAFSCFASPSVVFWLFFFLFFNFPMEGYNGVENPSLL